MVRVWSRGVNAAKVLCGMGTCPHGTWLGWGSGGSHGRKGAWKRGTRREGGSPGRNSERRGAVVQSEMEGASEAGGAAGPGRRGGAGHAGVAEAPAWRSVRTSQSRACSWRLRFTEEEARKQGKAYVLARGAGKKRGPGAQRASGRVRSGQWMSAVRLRRSVLGFAPCTRVQMQCEAHICVRRTEQGPNGRDRSSAGVRSAIVPHSTPRNVRGGAGRVQTSPAEARAGPELRIIDLYWGHVDLFPIRRPDAWIG